MLEVFSNHTGSASELTLIANVKQGFVPIAEPLTYSTRLRIHLRMFNAMRRAGQERLPKADYPGAIELLQTLNSVSWTLFDNDTKMLFAVDFDRSLEPYLRKIVDITGPLLDTILCHCEGFEGHSSDFGFEKFMEWGRTNQIPVEMFISSSPNFTTDDANYYVTLDQHLRRTGAAGPSVGEDYPGLRLKKPKARREVALRHLPVETLAQQLKLLIVLHDNFYRFNVAPAIDDMVQTSDATHYYNLTEMVVPMREILIGQLEAAGCAVAHLKNASLDDVDQELRKQAAEKKDENLSMAVGLLKKFEESYNWIKNRPARPPRDLGVAAPASDRIQSGLLRPSSKVTEVSFPKTPFKPTHACMVLLRARSPEMGYAFLDGLKEQLWGEASDSETLRMRLSITHQGLKSLELDEDLRLGFPEAFRQGMEARAGLLGDIMSNHPERWNWPRSNWPFDTDSTPPTHPSLIDFVVMLEGVFPAGVAKFPEFNEDHPLYGEIANLGMPAKKGIGAIDIVAVEPMHRNLGTTQAGHHIGHLGFADGVSQPKFGGSGDEPDHLPLGDLLLGHGESLNNGITTRDVGKIQSNGTFQVIRKIALDVEQFQIEAGDAAGEELMIGRKKNGDLLGEYGRGKDEAGQSTPLQSHVRRSNPRTKGTPRILRRGFSYGPPLRKGDKARRGLFFIAYNANISEQFEVIQRWISGGNSTGVSSFHGDPLLAPKRLGIDRSFHSSDGTKMRSQPLGADPAGRLEWGLYAFTPSKAGLEALLGHTSGARKSGLPWPVKALFDNPDASWNDWRLVIDDPDQEKMANREALWEHIRAKKGGRYQTKFAELIGSREEVQALFENKGQEFSVREYKRRMTPLIGDIYLGSDDTPASITAEKQALEDFMEQISARDLHKEVEAVADEVIKKMIEGELGFRVPAERLIFDVIGKLCKQWFGLPDEGIELGGPVKQTPPHCPAHVVVSSIYVFWPNLQDEGMGLARHLTVPLKNQVLANINGGATAPKGSFYEKLLELRDEDDKTWTPEKIQEMVLGACFGFIGPTTGSFRSVFYDWVSTGAFWRLQRVCDYGKAPEKLHDAIIQSMAKGPKPDLLHRKKMQPEKGEPDTVVFSIRSAIADGPYDRGMAEDLLFGGRHKNGVANHKAHPCPGKAMALATMTGCFTALMKYREVSDQGPVTLCVKN